MEFFAPLIRIFPRQLCGGAGEAALFIFALLVLAVGILSLVDDIYWRRRGRCVAAEIAGAKLLGRKYFTVYRFADQAGRQIEATALCGKKRPPRAGRKELLVMPPEHLNFRRRRSFLRRFIVCSLLLCPWAWVAGADVPVCGAAPWKAALVLAVFLGAVLSLKRLTSPPALPKSGAALQDKLGQVPVLPPEGK